MMARVKSIRKKKSRRTAIKAVGPGKRRREIRKPKAAKIVEKIEPDSSEDATQGPHIKVPVGLGKQRRKGKQKGRPKAAKTDDVENTESDTSDSSGDAIQDKQLRHCNNVLSYENLFKRLQDGMIYVRVSVRKSKLQASQVYFARDGQIYNQGNCYSFAKVNRGIPAYEEILRQWKLKAESGSMDDVCTMMAIFKEMTECIIKVAGEWEIIHDKVPQFNRKLDDIRDRHVQKNRLGKEFLVETFRNGRYINALQHSMHNAVGRKALESFLISACQCAFGFEYMSKGYVSVHSLGTSRSREESFPIKDVVIDEGLDFEAGAKYYVHASDLGTSTVRANEALKKGEVYPDLLVVEGTETTPKVLLVVEIKSKPDLGTQQIQIFREMFGPLLQQNLVFGLLLNASEAQLYLMERTDKGPTKKISVRCVEFSMSLDGIMLPELFNNFFLNVVSAMDFAKRNIKLTSALKSK